MSLSSERTPEWGWEGAGLGIPGRNHPALAYRQLVPPASLALLRGLNF